MMKWPKVEKSHRLRPSFDWGDVLVDSIEYLQFVKRSLAQSAFHNGQKDDLTMVTFQDGLAVIRTRLVSVSFEDDDNLDILARGTSALSFVK